MPPTDIRRRLRPAQDSVLVIGLGRFGGTLATTLVEMGSTVLGVARFSSTPTPA